MRLRKGLYFYFAIQKDCMAIFTVSELEMMEVNKESVIRIAQHPKCLEKEEQEEWLKIKKEKQSLQDRKLSNQIWLDQIEEKRL